MKKRSVCWNITSRCNENCKFCYRIMTNSENDLERNKKILELLSLLSVNKISWTGGEPLLYPNLIELLKMSKSYGIVNNLITNGKLLSKEKITELEPYLDYITLSYDSIDSITNKIIGRGAEHGAHVLEILDYIHDNKTDVKIKINTLVSKYNKEDVTSIGKILLKYNIERWRLFKFIPLRNYAIRNSENFKISNEEFKHVVTNVKKLYGEHIQISERNEEKIESYYLLINSVGDFIITENMRDKKIYNIEEENYEILKKYL